MAISVTLNTNAQQEARLTILMNRANLSRVSSGLPPFTDINDMAKAALIERLRGWNRELFAGESQIVASAWEEANDSVQTQVKNLLGI